MTDEGAINIETASAEIPATMLSLVIEEKAVLCAAYMPFVNGGGLFIPTNMTYRLGKEVFLLISLLGDPHKLKVVGKVVWITPATQGSKPQGIGVRFSDTAGGREARKKIEALLGGALKLSRSTYTM